MTRNERILSCVRRDGLGLEIGPSYNPVAPKRSGFNVEIADHLNQNALIEKYRPLGVDVGNIEEVDHVWQGQPLSELIGETGRYDWIVASHVIEHVPDVIGFLEQCQKLLRPDGVLSLAIPDKRFSFDHFRPLTTTGDILQAGIEKRSRHPPGWVFDHFVSEVHLSGLGTWSHGSRGTIAPARSLLDAKALLDYSCHPDAAYVDIHAWRFTPTSFRLAIEDLNQLGRLTLNIAQLTDTIGCEFFASMRSDTASTPGDRMKLLVKIEHELSEGRL
jgi:SAM-dependent methyltransferase